MFFCYYVVVVDDVIIVVVVIVIDTVIVIAFMFSFLVLRFKSVCGGMYVKMSVKPGILFEHFS